MKLCCFDILPSCTQVPNRHSIVLNFLDNTKLKQLQAIKSNVYCQDVPWFVLTIVVLLPFTS